MDENEYSVGDVTRHLMPTKRKMKAKTLVKKKLKKQDNTMSSLFGESSGCTKNNYFQNLLNISKENNSLDDNTTVTTVASKSKHRTGSSNIRQESVEDEGVSSSYQKSKSTQNITEAEGSDEEQDVAQQSRTVFVGNIPKAVKKLQLKILFQEYGTIETIRIRSVAPAESGIPQQVIAKTMDIHPQRDSYNAYVVFDKQSSARKALCSNGTILDGHHLRVDLADNDHKNENMKSTIFLGNLPFVISEEEVRLHFQDFGVLENVRLIRDSTTGLGKGFGFIQFQEKSSATLVLKLESPIFKGRKIRVSSVLSSKKLEEKDSLSSNEKSTSHTNKKPSEKFLKRIRHKQKVLERKKNSGLYSQDGKSSTPAAVKYDKVNVGGGAAARIEKKTNNDFKKQKHISWAADVDGRPGVQGHKSKFRNKTVNRSNRISHGGFNNKRESGGRAIKTMQKRHSRPNGPQQFLGKKTKFV